MFTGTLTEDLSIVDVINLTNNNNTNTNSTGVDMSKVKRLIYFIPFPLGAGAIDGRLQSAAASNFASPHNMTGTNLTTLNTNGTWTSVEVRSDQVTQQNAGDKFVRLQLTVSGGATNVQALGLGGQSEQRPAKQYDLNSTFVSTRVVCNT